MVYVLFYVESGVLNDVEFIEDKREALDTYEKWKNEFYSRQTHDIRMDELWDMEKGDYVEVYLNGGVIQQVEVVEEPKDVDGLSVEEDIHYYQFN